MSIDMFAYEESPTWYLNVHEDLTLLILGNLHCVIEIIVSRLLARKEKNTYYSRSTGKLTTSIS